MVEVGRWIEVLGERLLCRGDGFSCRGGGMRCENRGGSDGEKRQPDLRATSMRRDPGARVVALPARQLEKDTLASAREFGGRENFSRLEIRLEQSLEEVLCRYPPLALLPQD